jgi:uncharacterized membrane protein
MIWVLLFLLVVVSVALIISLIYLYKFGRIVLSYVDAIEESLDILNECYASVYQILQTPVGSDDPFVRSAVNEIKKSYDAILKVAQTLTQAWKGEKENET